MKIKELEKKMQREIHSALQIRDIPHNGVAGVYWRNVPIYVSLPRNEIREQSSQFYLDPTTGVPWRGVKEAMRDVRARYESVLRKTEKEDNA